MTQIFQRRPGGRHQPGAQTAALPDSEDTMTSTPQTAPDDVMDDWLDAYERAHQRAELAKASAASIQDTIGDGQQRADQMRAEARRLRQEAADKDATATALLAELGALAKKLGTARDNMARHNKTAQHHGGNIDAEIAKGVEDPRARRDRLAKQARERGAPQPHPNPLPQAPGPSPLDGPGVPIGREPTAPFPQHDLDAAQATPLPNGEPR